MRFWDTSAIVPLLITEPQSVTMRDTLADDPTIATAAIATIEITSALWRRRHRREISVGAHHDAEVNFASLTSAGTSPIRYFGQKTRRRRPRRGVPGPPLNFRALIPVAHLGHVRQVS